MARLLLAYSADVGSQDSDFSTPLHEVSRIGNDIGMAQSLLHHGADPNARNKEGETPSLIAWQC
jgi:ankyrin repeat protein